MPTHGSIYLFSKTPYPDVNHIPILVPSYLEADIDFSSYDYIIATSKETLTALDKLGNWKKLPVLAISDSTAEFAREMGAEVLDTAKGYGESVVALVRKKYHDLKGLYPHGKLVAFDIEEALKTSSIVIDSFIVYETLCSEAKVVDLPEDAICIFTSPSSVKCFEKKYQFLPSYKIVCIGETTRASLPKGIECTLSERTSVQSTISCAKSLL